MPADPSPTEPGPGARERFTAAAPRPAAAPAAGSLESIFGAMIDARIAALPPAGVSADDVRALLAEALAAGVLPPSTIKVDAMGAVREVSGARHYLFETAFIASGCHVWLPGPAGSGKSMLARQCFEALGYDEPGRGGIHMTGAIETPFQLLGYVSPNGDERTLQTPFRKAWERGGAFIFDDVDRSNAKALAAFNEALANGYCAFPDAVVKAHPDLRIVATANTYGTGGGAEYVGASRMDGATLTRFAKLTVPYDERLEAELAGREFAEWCRYVQSVRRAVDRLAVKHLVTPRATLLGVRLMLAGVKRETVEDATLWAGLDVATVARIKGAL
jgi:hypothetical protein